MENHPMKKQATKRRLPLCAFLFAATPGAFAQEQTASLQASENRLATPPQALQTFLFWQQPTHFRPEIAAELFKSDATLKPDETHTK